MVKLVANKTVGQRFPVSPTAFGTKLGLLVSTFLPRWMRTRCHIQLFDAVFPNPTEALVQKGYKSMPGRRM